MNVALLLDPILSPQQGFTEQRPQGWRKDSIVLPASQDETSLWELILSLEMVRVAYIYSVRNDKIQRFIPESLNL